jgi:hypothetical protein
MTSPGPATLDAPPASSTVWSSSGVAVCMRRGPVSEPVVVIRRPGDLGRIEL